MSTENIAKSLKMSSLEFNESFDISAGESFISRPVDKINIPEVKNLEAKFIYNYFTRDERVRGEASEIKDRIIELDASNTEEIFNRVTNKNYARYVKINFASPRISSENLDADLNVNSLNIDVNKIIDNLIAEGSVPNTVFTGVEIIDTGRENSLYTMLNGSMFFVDIPVDKESSVGAVSKLYDTLKEKGGLYGKDKLIIREAFRNMSSNGYKLAESDVHPDVAKTSSDPIGKQTISVQFNNLFMSDIIDDASLIPDNIFQDEIRSLKNFSGTIKKETLDNIPPANTFREIDYDLKVEAVDVFALPNINQTLESAKEQYKNFPDIKFIGYVLEKYEVLPDERTELIGKRFINGHNSQYAIDPDVRYGGSYFYKVRTICQVKFLGMIDNPYNPELNQVGIITCFMASEGVITNVYCIENVPPPPPQNLRVRFDFNSGYPIVYWQHPLNKQRDIKRYQIFKRLNTDEPFRLLKEYEFDNSLIKGPSSDPGIPPEDVITMLGPSFSLTDTSYQSGEKPIYAVCCVDAHGMSSNYSDQFKIERDVVSNKAKVSFISKAGAPKPYPNLFLNIDTFQDAIRASKYDRVKIVFDPEYYDVFKEKYTKNSTTGKDEIKMDSLNLLAIDSDNYRYKFHFINIDNQKDQFVNIKINTKASPTAGEEDFKTNVATYSDKNISFQYGV